MCFCVTGTAAEWYEHPSAMTPLGVGVFVAIQKAIYVMMKVTAPEFYTGGARFVVLGATQDRPRHA